MRPCHVMLNSLPSLDFIQVADAYIGEAWMPKGHVRAEVCPIPLGGQAEADVLCLWVMYECYSIRD
jgi:hypothetical protein